MGDRLAILTVKVPGIYIAMLDDLVRSGVYGSRSEAVRDAIRMLLKQYGSNMYIQRRAKQRSRVITIDID